MSCSALQATTMCPQVRLPQQGRGRGWERAKSGTDVEIFPANFMNRPVQCWKVDHADVDGPCFSDFDKPENYLGVFQKPLHPLLAGQTEDAEAVNSNRVLSVGILLRTLICPKPAETFYSYTGRSDFLQHRSMRALTRPAAAQRVELLFEKAARQAGPFLPFTRRCPAAPQLHQTSHSPRPRDRDGLELTLCGRSGPSPSRTRLLLFASRVWPKSWMLFQPDPGYIIPRRRRGLLH